MIRLKNILDIIKKFFREIADINTDVFYLEKIFSFPFKQFRLPIEEMFSHQYAEIFYRTLQLKSTVY
jgi:hypothetical protein